jgi:hypothetical protein
VFLRLGTTIPRFFIRAAACVLLAVLPGFLPAQTQRTGLGVYHWGGQYPHSINEGVVAIADLGGHVARIVLSPRYYLDYHIDSTCYPAFSLAAIAQEPDVRQALANPAIDVFMITAFDGVTYGDCQALNFLNPAFLTPDHFAQVVQEYSDFTLYLERTFRRTRKRFILSNWESDNSVFCGAAYSYATSPAIRNSCRSQYSSSFGIPSPEDALQGLKLWLQARSQGILDGEARARAAGLEDRRVFHAPEFNIVHALHDRGFPSVLYDVVRRAGAGSRHHSECHRNQRHHRGRERIPKGARQRCGRRRQQSLRRRCRSLGSALPVSVAALRFQSPQRLWSVRSFRTSYPACGLVPEPLPAG